MSASRASLYEILELHKEIEENNETRKVSLVGKTVSFNYFESVYSHDITANLTFLDAGGSVKANSEQDKQERFTSIKSGLPIEGGEKLFFSIKTLMNAKMIYLFNKVKDALNPTQSLVDRAFNVVDGSTDSLISGTLSKREANDGFLRLAFLSDPLIVTGSPVVASESNRQIVFLPLVSNPAIKNEQSLKETKTYKGKISDSVRKILKDMDIKRFKIDKTSNDYDFTTQGRGNLDLITELCRRSVPEKGDAGYFFYETSKGLNFRSVSNLVKKRPVATYTYSGVMQSNLDNDSNNFRIIRDPVFIKDENFKDRKKWETTKNMFFNPLTGEYNELIYDAEENPPEETMGKKTKFKGSRSRFKNNNKKDHGNTNYHILDIGTLEFDKLDPNNDPRKWQAQSLVRYNSLHSQIMEIQIPCNVKLQAGENIRVEFETQAESKSLGGLDEHRSGKYMILHLCHHFDTSRSFTSLTIARDTNGLHTGSED